MDDLAGVTAGRGIIGEWVRRNDCSALVSTAASAITTGTATPIASAVTAAAAAVRATSAKAAARRIAAATTAAAAAIAWSRASEAVFTHL
jgi:hypothetical protein